MTPSGRTATVVPRVAVCPSALSVASTSGPKGLVRRRVKTIRPRPDTERLRAVPPVREAQIWRDDRHKGQEGQLPEAASHSVRFPEREHPCDEPNRQRDGGNGCRKCQVEAVMTETRVESHLAEQHERKRRPHQHREFLKHVLAIGPIPDDERYRSNKQRKYDQRQSLGKHPAAQRNKDNDQQPGPESSLTSRTARPNSGYRDRAPHERKIADKGQDRRASVADGSVQPWIPATIAAKIAVLHSARVINDVPNRRNQRALM